MRTSGNRAGIPFPQSAAPARADFGEMAAMEAQCYGEDLITPAEKVWRWYLAQPCTTVAARVSSETPAPEESRYRRFWFRDGLTSDSGPNVADKRPRRTRREHQVEKSNVFRA